jgi:hypothetical protein
MVGLQGGTAGAVHLRGASGGLLIAQVARP